MSSKQAQWYHSMNFTYLKEWDDAEKKHGTINTWDDWHLIPTSRPVFNPPSVKEVYIDIPGSNGRLDMTESLAGYPLYDNRTGSFEFIVANGYRPLWIGGYQKFANWLHGKDLRCVLDDDPSYFYEGRFVMKEWKSNNDGTWSNVTFDYNVAPYKRSIRTSLDDWLWDPFNFETDVINKVNNITINRYVDLKIHTDMPVIPTLYLNSDHATQKFKVAINGTIIGNIPVGSFRDPRLELLPGYTSVKISVTEANHHDSVSVSFRGGSL